MFDLTKIFNEQVKLDQAIKEAHKITDDKSIHVQRVIALIVEISEFANEYESFKYWKKQRDIDFDKLVEEYVDALHLFVSMGLELKIKPIFTPLIISDNHNTQLIETFSAVVLLSKSFSTETLTRVFALFLGLAKQLGLTQSEIENSYFIKNKINFKRLKENY